MLDERLEDFTSDARFAGMVLGMLSLTGTATTLALHPRRDGGRGAAGPVASFLLGLVSVGQRLRTTLVLAEQRAPVAEQSPPPSPGPGLLR